MTNSKRQGAQVTDAICRIVRVPFYLLGLPLRVARALVGE